MLIITEDTLTGTAFCVSVSLSGSLHKPLYQFISEASMEACLHILALALPLARKLALGINVYATNLTLHEF